jgi:hypothetical protein
MTILLLNSLQCIAGIYMQKNADGNVTYSDVPFSNAQPVSLSPANSVPSTTSTPATGNTVAPAIGTTSTSAEEPAATDYYNTFTMISPANNETIQNQPVITVKVATDPEIRAGDTVQVFLDGKPWDKPVPGTSINLVNVERGEHTLYAKLLDNKQQTIKQTNAIKIFVHRASSNFNAANAGQTRLANLIL